jgi:hypothetical protein
MTYRCRVCSQPINREAAVLTAAGNFTDGYCAKHAIQTPDASPLLAVPGEGSNLDDQQGDGIPPQD